MIFHRFTRRVNVRTFSRVFPTSQDVRRENREFKQSTTAGATTAAVTEKVWGEYVSVVCKFLSLGQQNTKKHG